VNGVLTKLWLVIRLLAAVVVLLTALVKFDQARSGCANCSPPAGGPSSTWQSPQDLYYGPGRLSELAKRGLYEDGWCGAYDNGSDLDCKGEALGAQP
jgi:hypothetical protein